MTALLAERRADVKPIQLKQIVSIESFLSHYANRQNRFKYEWNNGIIEKTPRTMNRDQTLIQWRLIRLFATTAAFKNDCGLIVELDMFIKIENRTRRADIGFLNAEQMKASEKGDLSVSSFIIEIVSKNDKGYAIGKKLNEYFKSGAQVVWEIYPTLKKVEVYTSLRDVKICMGDDICSAAPVLPDFNISANAVFGDA